MPLRVVVSVPSACAPKQAVARLGKEEYTLVAGQSMELFVENDKPIRIRAATMTWQDDLIDEKRKLDMRIEAMSKTMSHPSFNELAATARMLMNMQLSTMQDLSVILGERLK